METEIIKIVSPVVSSSKQEFTKVNLDWFQFDRSYKFDLYMHTDGLYRLYCRKDLALSRSMADKVQRKTLYVHNNDKHLLQSYMEENIVDIVRDSSKPVREKSEAVYSASTNLVQELLKEPKAASIRGLKNIVNSQVELVLKTPGAINSLMSITQHDYYTYTHSVNVTIYLIGLGERLKMNSRDIYLLTMGGMLHDLGKAQISPEIINCNTKLTPEQFDEMKKHPEFGLKILKKIDPEAKMIPPECQNPILHHHEKYCGGGYPTPEMKGDGIPLFGRMTKICDVFDALTTRRAYKAEMSSFDALSMMRDKMPEEFDPDIFHEFLNLMSSYSADMRKKLHL